MRLVPTAETHGCPPVTGPSPGLQRIHVLLTVQTVVIVLASVNRLSDLTTAHVPPHEFLRWVDLLNLLVFPLASVVAFYLLKRHLEAGGPRPWQLPLDLAFLVGVYLLAASYGVHEVTNYLHARVCDGGAATASADVCQIIVFNDDEFSHWVFFAGFVLVNAALMLLQVVFPVASSLGLRDRALLVGNGLFIALGVFANLGFEEIGLDLYVVALLAALSVYLWRRVGTQPLVLYYLTAYCVGLGLTVVKLAVT